MDVAYYRELQELRGELEQRRLALRDAVVDTFGKPGFIEAVKAEDEVAQRLHSVNLVIEELEWLDRLSKLDREWSKQAS